MYTKPDRKLPIVNKVQPPTPPTRRAYLKVRITVQTVARPHQVLLRKKFVLQNDEAVEMVKKRLLESYEAYYKAKKDVQPIEVLHQVVGWAWTRYSCLTKC